MKNLKILSLFLTIIIVMSCFATSCGNSDTTTQGSIDRDTQSDDETTSPTEPTDKTDKIGFVSSKEYIKRALSTKKEGAIKIFLKKARQGQNYGDVLIYIRTSDPSNDCYVRYNLCYEQNDFAEITEENGETVPLTWYNGANNGSNRSNYRIKTAQICRADNGDFIKLYDVLEAGEISLAIKEIKKDENVRSGDFVGGYHGDEIIEVLNGIPQVSMKLDGVDIDLSGKEELLLEGDVLTFQQTTIINRCNTPSENIFRHTQNYTFDTLGVHNRQQLEFLTSDYEEGGNFLLDKANTYLQMFTFYRIDTLDEAYHLFDKNIFYNAFGKVVGIALTSQYKKEDTATLGTATQQYNTAVEYIGDEGIYAYTGFNVLDQSVTPYSSRITVRNSGDNKWYCSFNSPNESGQPKKGDIWSLDLIYYIDYDV